MGLITMNIIATKETKNTAIDAAAIPNRITPKNECQSIIFYSILLTYRIITAHAYVIRIDCSSVESGMISGCFPYLNDAQAGETRMLSPVAFLETDS